MKDLIALRKGGSAVENANVSAGPGGTAGAVPRRAMTLSLRLQSLAAVVLCACLVPTLRVAFSSVSDSHSSLHDREGAVTASFLLGRLRPAIAPTTTTGLYGNNVTAAVRRYVELKDLVASEAKKVRVDYDSTYNKANVVTSSTSWFTPQKICKDSGCCATTVAISLQPDDYQIINTLDGLDLADVRLQMYRNPPHVKFSGDILNEEMLPCLQPGTIIHLDNHGKILRYFFDKLRGRITVPYVLMTTESDADTPYLRGERLSSDDLLMRWYGTNPETPRNPRTRKTMDPRGKLSSMPLGLSKHHAQDKYLSPYLRMNNYTNPFRDKSRWTSLTRDATVDDFFVKFGVNRLSKKRQIIVDALCGEKNETTPASEEISGKDLLISCNARRADPDEIYSEASTYLFGMSPPGAGYDCYRTYELIFLGVIPIVEARRPASDELFRDLPVVQVDDIFDERGRIGKDALRERIVKAANEYIRSDEFRKGDFDKGWERLFLRYWRRRVLSEGGRDRHILTDEDGREYYQAWRYTPTHNGTMLCSEVGNCKA